MVAPVADVAELPAPKRKRAKAGEGHYPNWNAEKRRAYLREYMRKKRARLKAAAEVGHENSEGR